MSRVHRARQRHQTDSATPSSAGVLPSSASVSFASRAASSALACASRRQRSACAASAAAPAASATSTTTLPCECPLAWRRSAAATPAAVNGNPVSGTAASIGIRRRFFSTSESTASIEAALPTDMPTRYAGSQGHTAVYSGRHAMAAANNASCRAPCTVGVGSSPTTATKRPPRHALLSTASACCQWSFPPTQSMTCVHSGGK